MTNDNMMNPGWNAGPKTVRGSIGIEAAEFEIKRLQDANNKAIGRIINLEGTCQAQSKGIGRLSNEKVMLEAKVEALESERSDLLATIDAMNEENAQLAHRLWCLENPE